MTIKEIQEKANKLCAKRGHKLKKWRYEQLAGGKAWMAGCEHCWQYARLDKKTSWRPLIGTIFKYYSNPSEVKNRCGGAAIKAIYKRKDTLKRKSILKAYKEGGIEKVLILIIGDK